MKILSMLKNSSAIKMKWVEIRFLLYLLIRNFQDLYIERLIQVRKLCLDSAFFNDHEV